MIQRLRSLKGNYSLPFIPWQILTLVLLLLLAIFTTGTFALPAAVPKISFVTPAGSGSKTGLSWANASSDLQAMIDASASGDEIWVAGGTYTVPLANDGFIFKDGVKMYGGFAGTEVALADRNLALTANTSILSAGGKDYVLNSLGYPLTPATRLDGFTATHEARSNLLEWSTTSEINTDNFEIERSGDAKNFIKIAMVNAAGSGNFQYRYNNRTDYGGTFYYRLKMSDRDNTFTYSKIILVAGDENFAGIYPNSAGAMVTFQVSDALLKTTANLYNISGRRIQSVNIISVKQQINVKTLASGLYILRFADGAVERFVKE